MHSRSCRCNYVHCRWFWCLLAQARRPGIERYSHFHRSPVSATKFAFPEQRKEPLENASHVRNAVARFKQVKGVTEAERRAAWKRIQSAAKRYGVELE